MNYETVPRDLKRHKVSASSTQAFERSGQKHFGGHWGGGGGMMPPPCQIWLKRGEP